MTRIAALALVLCAACIGDAAPARRPAALGQWIWTRADLTRYAESAATHHELEAGVYIGAIHCDAASGALVARAGLSVTDPQAAAVTAVIRFEDGLDRCRRASDSLARFDTSLDSVVRVLRARSGAAPVRAVQLDYDAPQRALSAWAGSVRYLSRHALATDSVWITSLIAQLRQPEYGALFRGVVRGHVLQVFDTGEAASPAHVREAIRVAARAGMPFRLGLGAFERRTARGVTEHRMWFASIPQFAAVRGYAGLWIFPAGQRWTTLLAEGA